MENSEENFSSLDVVKKTFSFVWSSKNKIFPQLILIIISSYGGFFIIESPYSTLVNICLYLIISIVTVNVMIDSSRMVYFGIDKFTKKFPIVLGKREIKFFLIWVLFNFPNAINNRIRDFIDLMENPNIIILFLPIIISLISVYLGIRLILISPLISLDFDEVFKKSWMLTQNSKFNIIKSSFLFVIILVLPIWIIIIIENILNIRFFILPTIIGINFILGSVFLTVLFMDIEKLNKET